MPSRRQRLYRAASEERVNGESFPKAPAEAGVFICRTNWHQRSLGGMDCPVCNGARWLCEEHELTPYPCQCGGPYVPCRCNPAEDMPPGTRELCSTHEEDPA